jgi:hypothetical protein
MKLRLSTDLVTGLLFMALGLFAIIYGSRYALGTAARMGPGYYPFVISVALTLIGLALVIRSFFLEGEPIGSIGWRPLLLVLAGTLAFGIFIDRLGLLVSGILLIVAARIADRDFRFVESAVLALGLVALTGLVFLYGLGLPIKMIRF